MTLGDAPVDAGADALIAARLCAVDPMLGGIMLRRGAGGDRVIAALRAALPPDAPIKRLPVHIDDERLYGGLDLGATLAAGRPVGRAGLLAEADGGAVIVPMAERLREGVAAALAHALDTGAVVAERDGPRLVAPAQFVVLALDEGVEEEAVPMALAERLAFWIDAGEPQGPQSDAGGVWSAAPCALPDVSTMAMEALAATAATLGIESVRAPILALRAARAAAALAGREAVAEDDLALAARLVLGPRATRLPAPPQREDAAEAPPPPPTPPAPSSDAQSADEQRGEARPLDDIVLEAALAALPKDVLRRLATGVQRQRAKSVGKGARQRSPRRGRPVGVRAGVPRGGLRLSIIDTLRAAAPWQRLRAAAPGRLRLTREDLRIRRFQARAEALTIFAVDASGSAAVARLAEVKGAVELLLAEAYVKRAQVALIAFRGTAAELLLPPTRSLARAKRALGALPGGGGTPLAAGLAAARELAEAAQRRGRTPYLVILTDGRANIAVDGSAVRARADADAEAAARAIAAAGIATAFVDTSPRPRPEGAKLAAVMQARYLPLPRADARAMHAAVKEAHHA
ncbi:MAG: magnesium chelatase [Sphingobium sp.]|nr:magnesium chelatase [Sphingobium sp.]